MAQHDYHIADQPGASFLADLNAALAAIVSNNAGSIEPSQTYAHQLWADTTSGKLKMRNANNDAWVEIGTLGANNLGLQTALNFPLSIAQGGTGATTAEGARAALGASGLGVGQTWQDVTASRALNTNYTNSTGKPIYVIVIAQGTSTTYPGAISVHTSGVAVAAIGVSESNGTVWNILTNAISFIVPAGAIYSVAGSYASLYKWTELR